MDYTIRRMTRADLPAVLAIESVAFTSPWTCEMYEEEILAHDAIVMAGADGGIVGMMCGHRLFDEYEVTTIAVRPAERGRGLGRRLITDRIVAMRNDGVRFFFLEVRESNVPARKLYDSLGFKPIQIRRNYYRDPVENALVMALDMGPDPVSTPSDEKVNNADL
jgi:ribosomal-protein-alanine N-acetyltransferase